MKIYLAGPMDRLTLEEMKGWRDYCNEFFETQIKDGIIELLDPVRRPHTADLNCSEIYELDLIDVENCDLMLLDCRLHQRECWGSGAELFYAHRILHKPVIGWWDEEKKPQGMRLFLDHQVTRQFDDLTKALDHILEYYI